MAAQVKLVRRRDFGTDISSLSLFNFEDGFSLARDGWIQAVANGDAEVSEAMTLHVKGSSPDDLAAKLQLLDDKILEVGWYNDTAERYGVWLRAQMPDESEARQALVTSMRCRPTVSFYAPPVAPGNFIREGYGLALERMPWWEPLVYNSVSANAYCYGDTGNYSLASGPVVGNVPARIARTMFSGWIGGPLYEFWMGFRTDRWGNRANFVPLWECELGTYTGASHYDTALVDGVGGTDASGGAKLKCTFATQAGMKPRVTMTIEDVATNYSAQRGSYHVLLRARVDDTPTTCRVRLLDGFVSSTALRTQSRVTVSSDDWLLYPLGTINIPPSRGIEATAFLNRYGLRIEAERTAGSDNLEMDCLILIPRSEGSIYVSGGAVQYSAGDTRPVTVRMSPDRKISGWSYQSNSPIKSVAVESESYSLPIGDGMFVLAGQRETSHVLTDRITVSMLIYPRWRTLRGLDAMTVPR